jgi:hypothetical protein
MKGVLEFLVPVIVILLSLAVWSLWVFIKSPARPTVKAISIPATIAGVFVIVALMTTWLGRSVPLPLPDEVIVLAHHTVIKNGKKTNIEIWVKEPTATRLYIVLWSKELEQMLGAAESAREQGMQSKLKKGKKSDRKGGGEQNAPGEWTMIPQQNPDLPQKEEHQALPPGHPPVGDDPPVAPQPYHKPDDSFMK